MSPLGIFVVEDSRVCAAAIRAAITSDPGWSIIGYARDAYSAIDECSRLAPDVITLDLNMPGGGGLDMLSEIKAGCNAPVVIVSASTYEGSPVTAEALRLGADACFDKRNLLTDALSFLGTLRKVVEPH